MAPDNVGKLQKGKKGPKKGTKKGSVKAAFDEDEYLFENEGTT